MAKVACRVFRDPRNAQAAIEELVAKGFRGEEIGVVARDKELVARLVGQQAVVELQHPEMDKVTAAGPLAEVMARAGQDGELTAAMAQALDISEERYNYYEFGISVGQVLVSVHTSDQQLAQARQILRSAEAPPPTLPVRESSPGFVQAERMSATNPIDAPMSGDFRRY
ncbi:MAG TPA: hypothetical protein G4O03_08465 [Dehalococcoidia bacterium]|nr:hypothetical protein [Dehalococcoidia bacterium]